MTEEEIIKNWMETIKKDLIALYDERDRRATGQFAEGLESVYGPYSAELWGYEYLAGRGPTKGGYKAGEPYLWQSILVWLQARAIVPREKNVTQRGLAWMIAQKIHKQGTDRAKWLKVYDLVITPERIDEVIDKLSTLNVNRLITTVVAELELISKEFGGR